MGRPWHKADPENLARLEANIAEAFPDLKVVEEGECLFVRGYFPIAEGETVLDRFHIEVALPRNGPKGIFTVRELDGRIPRTPDRHVNDDRGTLCVTLPHAYYYEHPEGMDLLQFLRGPLHSHLAGQCVVELGGAWPDGEWAHGADGIIQFYKGVFETDEASQVVRYLDVLRHRDIKGHWTCPCGRGLAIRKCDCSRLNPLRRRVAPKLAEDAYRIIGRGCPDLVRTTAGL